MTTLMLSSGNDPHQLLPNTSILSIGMAGEWPSAFTCVGLILMTGLRTLLLVRAFPAHDNSAVNVTPHSPHKMVDMTHVG
jgi:hypothetical protein